MNDLEPEWFEEDPDLRYDNNEPKKSTQGRKRKPIDRDQLISLAGIGCTTDEIGKFFGVDGSVIRKRFGSLMHQVKARSKARIRQAQFDLAVNQQDKTMLIWLGKQFLNQGENGERSQDENQPLPWTDSDLPETFTVAEAPDETDDSASTSSDQ